MPRLVDDSVNAEPFIPILGILSFFDKIAKIGIRNNLIRKGMIWSPNRGDTAFTVPLFDEYMRRIMPEDSLRD